MPMKLSIKHICKLLIPITPVSIMKSLLCPWLCYGAGSACQIHWLMSLKHIKGVTFIMSATLTQIITNYVNLYFPLGNDQIQCVAI